MSDKLLIIRKVLETDAETDKKILELIASSHKVGTNGRQEAVIDLDERAYARKPVDFKADMAVDGEEEVEVLVKNISCTGAFVSTTDAVPRGKKISLSFTSPGGETFILPSEVVRVDDNGIGLLINGVSAMQLETFQEFVYNL